MTPAEARILAMTADLWEAIRALPVEHPCNLDEHCRDIHNIQCRVMARETARRSKTRTARRICRAD